MKRTGLILLMLAAAVLIAGCGKLVIDQGKAQGTVREFVKTHTNATATNVHCPDGVDAKKGVSFDCHFSAGGQKYVAHLHIQQVKGNDVYYEIQTALS